jgi:hypothetical protein
MYLQEEHTWSYRAVCIVHLLFRLLVGMRQHLWLSSSYFVRVTKGRCRMKKKICMDDMEHAE